MNTEVKERAESRFLAGITEQTAAPSIKTENARDGFGKMRMNLIWKCQL